MYDAHEADFKASEKNPFRRIYSGMNLLRLKYHKKEQNIITPHAPEIMSTHWNAPDSSNNGTWKFIPKTPAMTPKIATTNVAVVSSSSNWIS